MRHLPIKSQLFKENRKQLSELLVAKSLAVVNANDVLPTNADGSLVMHPNSDLFYLSGIEQEESILLLFPDASDPKSREVLFVREPNEHLQIWEGYKHSKEDARKISGIRNVKWISEFPGLFRILMCEATSAYLNCNEHKRAGVEVETRDDRFINQCKRDYPLQNFRRLAPLLHDLRVVKNPVEIDLLKEAVSITEKGFRRILKFVKPGVTEYEVEAEWAREFISRRAKFAYSPIIASGKNNCVLHYLQNDQTCKSGQLLLLDVGACYANYNADLTRTIPVSGKFTRRQKQVYNAVLRVIRASIAGATVGKLHSDWQKESEDMMTEELLKLGLLKPAQVKKQTADRPAAKKYFMHGLGHPLGLDVHDVGDSTKPFEAGCVLTVEPGIYIPEEGFGVRLEDDIVVTNDGPVNLMAKTPIETDEIEAIMNR
ncbi:MAG: Xaa-Pro aminopeptidase [Verrucomicrobia bacterium]|nr:aminopeptidase P N-terminal domain-containing protein [Verrucomicrobiota bacterium]MDA1048571.1 Xaa-Pro aminopeptidase [Verrucomicrobiota bacterium]